MCCVRYALECVQVGNSGLLVLLRLRPFAALGVPRHGWEDVGPNRPALAVEDKRLGQGSTTSYV